MMHVWNTLADWRTRRRTLTGAVLVSSPRWERFIGGTVRWWSDAARKMKLSWSAFSLIRRNSTIPRILIDIRAPSIGSALLESLGVDEVMVPNVRGTVSAWLPLSRGAGRERSGAGRRASAGFPAGVMTVVLKLLNLVRADRAYFGEKDYQQLKIISEMAQEFFIPTQIIPCPTVREESGLAMSSRNTLLSADAHDKAAVLFRALTTASSCPEARAVLEGEGFRVEYVEEHWGRRLAAVNLEGVRLIDNVPVAER